jgi:mono/diheme cytochrome c family protein
MPFMVRSGVAFLVLVGAVALLAAGCGGDDSSSDAEETAPPATETSGGDTGGESGDPANGKKVFASAGCGGCHTFEAAGSTGSVGPNLDDASPSFDEVVTQVTNGGGAMPAFGDELSEQEIRDVAAFVSGSSSGS